MEVKVTAEFVDEDAIDEVIEKLNEKLAEKQE